MIVTSGDRAVPTHSRGCVALTWLCDGVVDGWPCGCPGEWGLCSPRHMQTVLCGVCLGDMGCVGSVSFTLPYAGTQTLQALVACPPMYHLMKFIPLYSKTQRPCTSTPMIDSL